MDFPICDLMDELAGYAKLLSLLHPQGLRSPQCQALLLKAITNNFLRVLLGTLALADQPKLADTRKKT